MCYYIGIEDLAANAMIEILKKKRKNAESLNKIGVKFDDLEEYGAAVVRYINSETKEKALLILSGASTAYMFRNYSDFFEETADESGIKLKEGKTVEDLEERFRAYESADVIRAYMAEATVKILYDRWYIGAAKK